MRTSYFKREDPTNRGKGGEAGEGYLGSLQEDVPYASLGEALKRLPGEIFSLYSNG